MELLWAEPSVADLEEIEAYLAKDFPNRAVQSIVEIITIAEMLKTHPRMGRMGRVSGTREPVFNKIPIILIYRIHGKVIQIIRVLHSSRKWPDSNEPTAKGPL